MPELALPLLGFARITDTGSAEQTINGVVDHYLYAGIEPLEPGTVTIIAEGGTESDSAPCSLVCHRLADR